MAYHFLPSAYPTKERQTPLEMLTSLDILCRTYTNCITGANWAPGAALVVDEIEMPFPIFSLVLFSLCLCGCAPEVPAHGSGMDCVCYALHEGYVQS